MKIKPYPLWERETQLKFKMWLVKLVLLELVIGLLALLAHKWWLAMLSFNLVVAVSLLAVWGLHSLGQKHDEWSHELEEIKERKNVR